MCVLLCVVYYTVQRISVSSTAIFFHLLFFKPILFFFFFFSFLFFFFFFLFAVCFFFCCFFVCGFFCCFLFNTLRTHTNTIVEFCFKLGVCVYVCSVVLCTTPCNVSVFPQPRFFSFTF